MTILTEAKSDLNVLSWWIDNALSDAHDLISNGEMNTDSSLAVWEHVLMSVYLRETGPQ